MPIPIASPPFHLAEDQLAARIIGAFYAVYNELRFGFFESVYCAALELEFQEREIPYVREFPLSVHYRGSMIGTYRADFFVGHRAMVEVKATMALTDADRKQLRHYLKATDTERGLLLHFGQTARFQRMIYLREERSS